MKHRLQMLIAYIFIHGIVTLFICKLEMRNSAPFNFPFLSSLISNSYHECCDETTKSNFPHIQWFLLLWRVSLAMLHYFKRSFLFLTFGCNIWQMHNLHQIFKVLLEEVAMVVAPQSIPICICCLNEIIQNDHNTGNLEFVVFDCNWQ